jgi:hypothetical protein
MDGCGGRSVFISYRRQLSEPLAVAVRKELTEHKFDVFMDVRNLDSGEFERTILGQIETREHFIVLLQPGSLDRISENGDWLRREIAHALAHSRNVVPVTADGFEFRRGLKLPPDVARLPSFNAVSIQPGYYDEAFKRLRKRFLKTSPRPAAPLLPETRSVVEADRLLLPPERPSGAKFEFPALLAPKLTATQESFRVQLTWSAVLGAQEYVLERATDLKDPTSFAEVYRGPNRSYDAGPMGLRIYNYRVRASVSGQAGKWSNTEYVFSER